MVGLLRDCTCVEAGDGKSAWAELEKAPFDLLVLDVNLPGMSGPELLERVRVDEKMRERTRTLCSTPTASISVNIDEPP